MTLRYIYWSVYSKPTGNSRVEGTTTCSLKCDHKGNHKHGPACKVNGCASPCDKKGHNVVIKTTRSKKRTVSVSKALQTARSESATIASKVGASAGGFTGEISASATVGRSESTSIGKTISSSIGGTVSGSTTISLNHFNKTPCTIAVRTYGTIEYEVRLILQIMEQDYTSTSWETGGAHGVSPAGAISRFGAPRFVGTPTDVQLATYDVVSDAPLSESSKLHCKCSPKAQITPNPHGDDPPPDKGKSKFQITPDTGEKVHFTNSLAGPVLVATASGTVTVDPGKQTEIADNETGPILVQTVTGQTILSAYVDRGTSPPAQSEEIAPGEPIPDESWDHGDGFAGDAPPLDAPEHSPAKPTSGFTKFKPDGIPSRAVATMGGQLQHGVIEGTFPKDTVFSIESPSGISQGTTFFQVGDGTSVRESYVIFEPLPGAPESGRLTARDPDGLRLGQIDIEFYQAQIETSLDPVSGTPGSAATLTIDCRAVVALLTLQTGAEATDFEVQIDYSNARGAQGPASAPLDETGVARVPITRGGVPGEIHFGVALAYRPVEESPPDECCDEK
jgi:hypothetical protein